MTIAQIKYFVTVAKCLSFTKAAEQLFVSQPALSRHIKNMEEELNIQLFVRTSNGIRLISHPGIRVLSVCYYIYRHPGFCSRGSYNI